MSSTLQNSFESSNDHFGRKCQPGQLGCLSQALVLYLTLKIEPQSFQTISLLTRAGGFNSALKEKRAAGRC